MGSSCRCRVVACLLAVSVATGAHAQDGDFTTQEQPGQVIISLRGQEIAEYVYNDEQVLRPHFRSLRTTGGIPVTRNHPPVPGVDPLDHDTMHPGLWLGFGDVSGQDFWRNKSRIEHVRFTRLPKSVGNRLTFATESRLLTQQGQILGRLNGEYEFRVSPDGWLLIWTATFVAGEEELVFGDQEEMGFGVRVATPLTEKNGGRLASATGRTTAAQTWGQPAPWCDYSGTVEGNPVGVTLMADPGNFRECWWHNRDYGLFVANPFGRAAMKQGEQSRVPVNPGTSLRLRFGASVHGGPDYRPQSAWELFTGKVD